MFRAALEKICCDGARHVGSPSRVETAVVVAVQGHGLMRRLNVASVLAPDGDSATSVK